MNCFCAKEFNENYYKIVDIEFENGIKYCEMWATDLIEITLIKIGGNLLIVIINTIAEGIFVKVS